jgi:drug/metabolite transporter (DMT)-like permease
VSILFALAAALCNALNVLTQHIASTAPRRSRGWRFILDLFRSPMWLFGWVAVAGAFIFQAFALHNGQLSVVQPLLVTELVFVLVLRRFWIRQSIRRITWTAGALTSIGLALFLVAAEPQGGHYLPTSSAWRAATIASIVVVAVLAALGLRGSPGWRAAFYGSATAVMWALVATFIKATTDDITRFGVGFFAHWHVYALAASGLVAEVLTQAALHVGPLSLSQPFMVIIDPIVSIILSVWIFGEHFTPSAASLALGTVAFAGMCVGVVLLTRTAPETMDPAGART